MKGKFVLGSPAIEVEVDGRKVPALLDTGFNGWLMLPELIIEELNLKKTAATECLIEYLSADGKKNITAAYKGKVKICDEEISTWIFASSLNFAIAGMALLHNYKITIERNRELVEIEKSVRA